MSGTTQKVIKGISTQTVVTIALGVVEIVSFSIMSRLLSQKDFGYYAAITAVAVIFQSLSETGIGSAIVQKKELDKKYINCAFSLSLILGIIIAGLLCLTSGFIADFVADQTMANPLRIFSLTLICSCLSSVNISLLQRNLKFLQIGLIHFFALIITTIVAVILALKGMGYYAILTKAVLQSILVLIISSFAVKIRYSFIFDKNEYKKIFGFGGWLMFSAVFRNIANQTDRLLMTSLFSIETLGLYTRPKEFIYTITGKCNSIFDSVLFPVLSTLQDDKEKLQLSFHNTLYFLNIMAMLIALIFFCNSELIIRTFFGEEWLHVNTLFMVLSFYPILLINGRMSDCFLRSLALTKQQFFFRIGQFVFAIVFILIGYRWGIIAVALSIMLSYGCITSIKILFVMKKLQLNIYNCVVIFLHSFRYCLFVFPIYFICYYFVPHSMFGNIITAIVFALTISLLFLVFPKLIGKKYNNEGYIKIKSFLKKR